MCVCVCVCVRAYVRFAPASLQKNGSLIFKHIVMPSFGILSLLLNCTQRKTFSTLHSTATSPSMYLNVTPNTCVHTHTHTHTHKSQPILPWTQNRVCGHLKAPRTIPWYPLDRKAIRLCSPSKREAEQAAPFRRAECIPSRPYIASSFIYLDIFFGHRRQE